jgi:hypothetical protein
MEHLTRKINIIVIILAILGFFYVKSALNEDSIKVEEKPARETSVSVRPVKVRLTVNPLVGNTQQYDIRLRNIDSVYNLLEALIPEGFSYERVVYTTGIEFEHINGIYPPENYKWQLFVSTDNDLVDEAEDAIDLEDDEYDLLTRASISEQNITASISGMNLIHKAIYEFRLIHISELQ